MEYLRTEEETLPRRLSAPGQASLDVLPLPFDLILMSDAPKAMKAADTVMQGYMLKFVQAVSWYCVRRADRRLRRPIIPRTHRKKRKKMQGMARRYFWLSPAVSCPPPYIAVPTTALLTRRASG